MKQLSVLGVWGVAIALFMLGGCGGKGNGTDGGGDGGVTTGECAVDNSPDPSLTPDPAWELIPGTDSPFNYICPAKDLDYFWFKANDPGTILKVHLRNNVFSSPIDLCYSIIGPMKDGKPGEETKAKCRGDVQGQIDLQATHYLAASGTYFIKVYANNGKEDRIHPYLIRIDQVVDPDKYEINDTKAQAKTVVAGQKGYISYLGDQDWFKIYVADADKDKLLAINLTADATPVDLHYDVIYDDGTQNGFPVSSNENYDGTKGTNISDRLALHKSGTYYVKVTDTLDDDSDTTVGYTLTLSLAIEPDTNEPNDDPAQATPIYTGSPLTAYIGSRGDKDWYKISSNNVTLDTPKLLEVEVTFNDSSNVTSPAVVIVVADPTTDCSNDSDCYILTPDCKTSRACFTGECTTNNKCRGGGICLPSLPSKTCAIEQLVMTSTPDNWRTDFTVSNKPRHLRTATPMYGNDYYILVKDSQNQKFDLSQQPYTIAVNVIAEPDKNEMNSLYLPYVDDDMDKALRAVNANYYAKDAPCTPNGTTEIDCTITGYLSFRGDQDWYKLVGITGIREDAPYATTQWKDWNLDISWNNQATNTDLNFEIFKASDLIIPKISIDQNLVTYTHIGGSTKVCSYLCGEYTFYGSNDVIYLRVQHSNRTEYNYNSPYILTIKATLECPANCGHCNQNCYCYGCPTPLNPNPQSSTCVEAACKDPT